MNILVSACLLGVCCRYDGGGKPDGRVLALQKRHTLIPVCPEQLGGLPTPRPPAEIRGGRVVNREGQDVTACYKRGAQEALRLARLYGCTHAVLKARSPACGSGGVYDGTFSKTLAPGQGVTAAALMRHGICVTDEDGIEHLFNL